MKLKGKDFILRKPKLDDAKNIFKYQQDKETKKNFMSVPKSIVEVKKSIAKKKKNNFELVIEVNGEVVGEIGIHDIIQNHKATMSYWIAQKMRGKGIVTKATKIFTNYVFKKYQLKRISGNARTFNKASARVLEKAGFRMEGILKKNKFGGGKYLDDMVWAKVK